jgi:hypothetical protein
MSSDAKPSTVTNYNFLCDLENEVARARGKFPQTAMMMTALMEEVGELAQALLHVRLGNGTSAEVYAEAVQVATMAMRVATEGDADYPQYQPDDGYRAFPPKKAVTP